MRDSIVNKIKNNGGTVVPLEKNADILIADHARKDAPAGSYSWKFVTESVENGIIQIKDRYRIGPDPDLPRTVGSTDRPGKATRTRFTHSEDVALVKWVLRHGEHFAGNKIYQEFERANPRHTWQSWRDRFTKMLQPRGQAHLDELAREATPEPAVPAEEAQRAPNEAAGDAQNSAHQKASRATPKGPAQSKRNQAGSHKQDPRSSVATRASETSREPSTSPTTTPAKSALAHTPEKPEEREPPSPIADTSEEDEMDTMARIFINDILTYGEEVGKDIDLATRIGEKIVGLWELSQAVEAQKVHPDEVDWLKVAEDLGYDFDPTGEVPKELCDCYRDNLVDFLEAMADYDSGGEEIKSGSDLSIAALRASRSPGLFLSPPSPSKPASHKTATKKRTADIDQSNSSRKGKRRRLDPTVEIPSTPEEELQSTKKPLVPQTVSPSIRKTLTGGRSQSTNGSRRLVSPPHDEGLTEDEDAAFETQVRYPPTLQTQESSVEVTPSQQLHSEAMDVTPIPLDLQKKTGTSKKIPTTSPSPPGPQVDKKKAKAAKRRLPAAFREHSPKASSKDDQLGIRYWVDHYQALGYSHKIVVEAMDRTTLTPGFLAVTVMNSLRDGQGVPKDWEGVWTDRDDTVLRRVDASKAAGSAANAKAIRKAQKDEQRLRNKHTEDGVALRRQYLKDKDSIEKE
ncbi:hypothetical protein ACCO45_004119 [Purpureocillium lilacinum]|uniref:Uncharacterized protein n=1 Tax=Purpureocillium lilacinum TaxID=33203 RepID=A0ACC4E1U0_PURLI